MLVKKKIAGTQTGAGIFQRGIVQEYRAQDGPLGVKVGGKFFCYVRREWGNTGTAECDSRQFRALHATGENANGLEDAGVLPTSQI